MKLSFVIPAWNEEELIGATIASIHQSAKGFDYEIVVADDASDDRTSEIAHELGAIVVPCNNRQIGVTRNNGASAATGDILIFVDADTLVSKEVVEETVQALNSGAVAGGSFPKFDEKVPLIAKLLVPCLKIAFSIVGVAAGAYLFCTKEAFEKAGKFNSKYYAAEEVHLSHQLRKQGKFKTINSQVVTSGRKFKQHSNTEMLTTLILVSIPGIRNIKKRKKLWYGERE
jgi:glycosyltransferase involved in cell wall biosynthesis